LPKSSHVFLLIEENQSFATVYNNQMPYLSSLSRTHAYAANYTSTTAGSMLDYLMVSSGNDQTKDGCGGWGCPNQLSKPLTDDNIFREVTKAGLTWKVYAESLPQTGYLLDGPFPYLNRHNAAVWYSDIVNSTEMQQNIVPFTELAKDIAANTLPNYAIIIPNALHDAHDGTPKQADDWLVSNVKPLLSSPVFGASGDALMLITFDECGSATNSGCGAHVLTTVIGPKVRPKFVSNVAYNHLDALHTIMDALGIPVYPGASAKAKSMADFF
jgi:acid phosphatase